MSQSPPGAQDRDGLLATLVPRITNVGRLLGDALQAGWHPDDGVPPFLALNWVLGLDVVSRVQDTLRFPRLSDHGIALGQAIERAFAQHGALCRPEEGRARGQLYAWRTAYRSENLRVWDLDQGNQGMVLLGLSTGDVAGTDVMLLRSQDEVFSAPMDDSVALEDLVALAVSSFDDARQVCPVPLRRVPVAPGAIPFAFEPWWPDETHPLFSSVQGLHRRNALREWTHVGPLLQQAEIRRAVKRDCEARFVGGMSPFDDPESACGFGTYTTWSAVGGLLPNETSHVAVQHPGSSVIGLMRRSDLEEVWRARSEPLPGGAALVDVFEAGFPVEQAALLAKAIDTFAV